MEAVVGGRTTATAATANVVAAQLWNPSSTQRIAVVEVGYAVTTAGVANFALRRSTARGTATTTVTPTIDNDLGRSVAPPSGCLLDLAFSAQPTLATHPGLFPWNTPAAVGAGVIFSIPRELIIPPGTGLCITTTVAVAFPASDVSFHWVE